MDNPKLYGLPGADMLHHDPAGVWENEIEPYGVDGTEWHIEEWTLHDPIDHIPSADSVIEWLVETSADNQELEESYENFQHASSKREVLVLVERVRSLIAEGVNYFSAKDHVATLKLTLDGDGRPLLDGQPLYRKVCRVRTESEYVGVECGLQPDGKDCSMAGITGGCVFVKPQQKGDK